MLAWITRIVVLFGILTAIYLALSLYNRWAERKRLRAEYEALKAGPEAPPGDEASFVDHGMNIAEAIEEGRIHHQWLPDRTSFEEGRFSGDTLRLYQAKGHEAYTRSSQGAAMGIWVDYEAGIYQGASDSRRGDGAAVGY